jgi:hypothetical protein
MKKEFAVCSKLTCIVVLAAIVALASPVLLAAQVVVQKPLSLVFTATFAPKIGLGPSLQYEFLAEGFLPATKVAMAWGKQYSQQNVLVSLVPKALVPGEIYTATFAPKVGEGPSMQYEFQVAQGPSTGKDPSANDERFLRTMRAALGWGKEYCPQNVLVSFVPKSRTPQETSLTQDAVTSNVGVRQDGLLTPGQFVFTTRFVSRDTGLVMEQELPAASLIQAARQTLAWGKQHCPEHVLFSIIQN